MTDVLRPPALGEPLSDREITILMGVADGLTDHTIASGIGVCESTIKTYLRRTYCKLGARNRTHAVVLAHRAGVLDLSGPYPRSTHHPHECSDRKALRKIRQLHDLWCQYGPPSERWWTYRLNQLGDILKDTP